MLGGQIAHLQPEGCRGRPDRAVIGRIAGHLEKPAAEEEDHAWIVRVTELAVHRQTEQVTVEPAAALSVDRSNQYPAAQHVHRYDLAPCWCGSCTPPSPRLRPGRCAVLH